MASIIRIKRSSGILAPASLKTAELAYAYGTGTTGNHGDRLFVGKGDDGTGTATSVVVIGGSYFTDMLDHNPGLLRTNSAIIVDSDKKIEELKSGNIHIDGFNDKITGLVDPTDSSGAATKRYVDNLTQLTGITLTGDSGTDAVNLADSGLNFQGQPGEIHTKITNNNLLISLDSSGVTAGTYGGATSIPIIKVDDFGRVDSVGTSPLSTTLMVSADSGTADSVDLINDTLNFSGSTGIVTKVTDGNIDIRLDSTGIVHSSGTTHTDGNKKYGTGSGLEIAVDDFGRISHVVNTTINAELRVRDDPSNPYKSLFLGGQNDLIIKEGAGVKVALTGPTHGGGGADYTPGTFEISVDSGGTVAGQSVTGDSARFNAIYSRTGQNMTIAPNTDSGGTITIGTRYGYSQAQGNHKLDLTNVGLKAGVIKGETVGTTYLGSWDVPFAGLTNWYDLGFRGGSSHMYILDGQDSALTVTSRDNFGNVGTDMMTFNTNDSVVSFHRKAIFNKDIDRGQIVDSGIYGNAAAIPVFTVNKSGLIDSIGTVAVAGVDSASWGSASTHYRPGSGVVGDNLLTITTGDGTSHQVEISQWADSVQFGSHVRFSHQPNDKVIVPHNTKLSFQDHSHTGISGSPQAATMFRNSGVTGEFEFYNNGDIKIWSSGNKGVYFPGKVEFENAVAFDDSATFTKVSVDNVTIDGNTISSTDGSNTLYLDPSPVGDSGDLVVRGNLTVQGTQTTVNSTVVSLNDKNLVLADSAANAAAADGAGLTVGGAGYSGTKPEFAFDAATNRWDPNLPLDIPHASLDSALFLNGTPIRTAIDASFDSNIGEISGHIVPAGNELYDLGDSLNRFRDLYISGNSVSFGGLVMSEHTGRVRFTNHTTGAEVKIASSNINQHKIDSSVILDLVDSAYLNPTIQSLNYLDSGQLNTRIDAFIDSAVFALIDSSFYLDSALMKQIPSVTGGVLTYDSSTGQFGTQTGDYLYSKSRFDSDFNAKSTTQLSEGNNQYYLKSRVDSDISAKVTGSFVNQLTILADDATKFRGQDSAYYLDYNNFTSTPFILDSSMVKNIFSTTDSSVLSYNSNSGQFQFKQTNLYTSTKFDSDFDSAYGTKTTTNLPEGSNLYYTTGRHDSDLIAGFAARSTNNLSEGASNKYYTTNRVDSDIDARVTKTYVDNLGINATHLNGQAGGHYLDYVNFTNTPNVLDSTNVKNIFSVAGGVLAYNASNGALSTIPNALYRKATFDSDLALSTTNDLSEGTTNKYYTKARADSDAKNAVSVTDAGGDGSLAYNSTTGVLTYTGPSAAETRAHFTGGNGISISSGEIKTDSSANIEFGSVAINGRTIYGGNYGAVNINKNNTLGDSTASVLGYTSDDSSRNAVFNLAIDNRNNANIGLTLNNEFIFGTQGADLTYKFVKSTGVNPINFTSPSTLFEIAPSGNSKFYSGTDAISKTSASLVLVGGLGVDKTIRSNDIVVVNNIQAGTNGTGKFIGNLDGTVDDISNHSTTNLSEGTNLYYTTTRFDSDLGATTTAHLPEGSNLYYTTARADSDAKNAISVNDAGGDGSLAYNATTGLLTYTGPSAAEARAHFTGGTGVNISSGGVISIGQAVSTTDSVEYGGGLFTGNVTIQGDLTITGTQTATAQADLSVSNAYITVADSNQGDTLDIGIVGSYSKDGGSTIRRTGFVRDASNGEWYVFDNLVQDNIDSSPRSQTINLTDSTVALPTWNFGALRGQYLGFDSDFTQYSTNYQVKTADFTAVSAKRYAVNTTGGQVVCTLPASPSTGDYVKLIDISNWTGNKTVILNRNGSTIEGYTDNFELDLGQSIIELIYINSTWNIYSSIGQRGPQGEKGDSADVASFATSSQAIAFSIGLG